MTGDCDCCDKVGVPLAPMSRATRMLRSSSASARAALAGTFDISTPATRAAAAMLAGVTGPPS